MIRDNQREECVRLYQEGRHTIRQIMSLTGIRSEQTIYRILDEHGVPRRPKRPVSMSATISFDEETAAIIDQAAPLNLSEWVCRMIQEANSAQKRK